MKKLLILLGGLLISLSIFTQTVTNDYYDVKSGDYRGIRFWSSNSYKIHMGNESEYKYGPVQDYSIKMNMNDDADRGWTWGVTGQTPVAALNTTGTMQLKQNLFVLGNLGIGTTSPLSDIHIHSNSSSVLPSLRFTKPDNNQGGSYTVDYRFSIRRYSISGGGYENNFSLYTVNGGNEKLLLDIDRYGVFYFSRYIDSNNKNYGMDLSDSRLSIRAAGDIVTSGAIKTNELEVVALDASKISTDEIYVKVENVADYVFHEEYALRSLLEVEQFITEHQHLPDIPAAKVLEAEGMNVAEMNNLLLQKVEELTLYLIDLQKQNQLLEVRLNKLND